MLFVECSASWFSKRHFSLHNHLVRREFFSPHFAKMEIEAQNSDVTLGESVSCRALLRSCYSGLVVFPPPQDLLDLGVALGVEKSKSLFPPDLGTCREMVSLWRSLGFRVQLLSRASH